jgi:hypothetical protein
MVKSIKIFAQLQQLQLQQQQQKCPFATLFAGLAFRRAETIIRSLLDAAAVSINDIP